MRNQEGKIELQKKVHRRICVRETSRFLSAHPLSYVIFVTFFVSPYPSGVLKITTLNNNFDYV